MLPSSKPSRHVYSSWVSVQDAARVRLSDGLRGICKPCFPQYLMRAILLGDRHITWPGSGGLEESRIKRDITELLSWSAKKRKNSNAVDVLCVVGALKNV